MNVELQEWIALGIAWVVIGFSIYRLLRGVLGKSFEQFLLKRGKISLAMKLHHSKKSPFKKGCH